MATILELAVAALYLAGAAFNATYTLRNPESFYGSFADGAWLGSARTLIRGVVIPNGQLLTIALVGLQVAVAALILAGGDAALVGLVMGATFSLGAAVVSGPAGTTANLALAALQAVLAAVH
jgi:hypothetical protein